MPPFGQLGHLSVAQRLVSSILLSVAYIEPNSKTERPRKTKLVTEVPQVTHDSHTDFKVKVMGSVSAQEKNVPFVAATAMIFKFVTHICHGQFLPTDHRLAPKWPAGGMTLFGYFVICRYFAER